MTPTSLCAAVEVALNRYLALEPAMLGRCAALDGRCIALQIDGWGWTLLLEFMPRGVRVAAEAEREADVTVAGAPAALARLGWSPAGSLPAGVRVEGDAELLHSLRRMLAEVGFDAEELLAPVLGGVAAHRLVAAAQALFGWSRQGLQDLSLNTAEYLREETRDLARAADVEDWAQDVETLRERADRFEAALRRLERRMGETS